MLDSETVTTMAVNFLLWLVCSYLLSASGCSVLSQNQCINIVTTYHDVVSSDLFLPLVKSSFNVIRCSHIRGLFVITSGTMF